MLVAFNHSCFNSVRVKLTVKTCTTKLFFEVTNVYLWYSILSPLNLFIEQFRKKKSSPFICVKTQSELNLNIAVCVTLEPVGE